MAAASSLDIPRLLARIAGGETSAFADIVRHYQKPLFGFLGRMGLPQAQAEEVAQDTFLRAWRSLPSFDPTRAEFSTWLFTIARNAAINEHARPAAQRERAAGDDEAAGWVCEQPRPCEALEATQARERLQTALRRLPSADRTLLALAYTRELPIDAIARIEGCKPGAIKTRLHRARRQLHDILMEDANGIRA